MKEAVKRFPNICFVKVGWSEAYQGGEVYGRHQHLKRYKGGHEALNFLPGPDGRYYVYAPPHKMPENPENWLVIIVAAGTGNNGRSFGPLEPVGLLYDATFVEERPRPEYDHDTDFKLSSDGKKFHYTLVSDRAVVIPADQRAIPLPKEHGRRLGMSSRVVVRENGRTKNGDRWRADYSDYAAELVRLFSPEAMGVAKINQALTDPTILAQDPTARGYATAEHRRHVEKAAEQYARSFFQGTFDISPVMTENRGYDFYMRKRSSGEEMFLEIKGTAGATRAFFLTANEWRCLADHPDKYRIFVVTNALSANPQGKLIAQDELQLSFSMEPLAWRIMPKA